MTLQEVVLKFGKKAQGRAELLRHLAGTPLCRSEAIRAKCYECMGYAADGPRDCTIKDCPLYPFMAYGRKEVPQKDLSDLPLFSET